MTLRTEPADPVTVLDERPVGRYVVQTFVHDLTSHIVYRVLLNGRKLRCWSHGDEHKFPKRAAKVGHEMVIAARDQAKERTLWL
jgi:hypothetical protein